MRVDYLLLRTIFLFLRYSKYVSYYPIPKKFKPVKKGINVVALQVVANKFALINNHIEKGEEISQELTKNFVSFPLSDDPYSEIE